MLPKRGFQFIKKNGICKKRLICKEKSGTVKKVKLVPYKHTTSIPR